MADPLLTPALTGAALSLLLNEVIDSCKGAIRLKESCKALKTKLDNIVPRLGQADQNTIDVNKAYLDWLSKFDGILKKVECLAKECLQECKCGKLKRLIKVRHWRKLANRIKDINYQIDEVGLNGILSTFGVIHAKPKNDFVRQSTPAVIVGTHTQFKKLKTSILASHTSARANYLGVKGSGGAGKTLLAQQLHNDTDVQAKYGKEAILWITVGLDGRICDVYKSMGKFLKDGIFEEEYAHRDQEDQRTYLLNAFAKKKVFMVLDDVWEKQLDHREMIYWLNISTAPGSTTLITTRSATILLKVQAQIFEISLLSNDDSWKLFCYYAFQSDTCPSTTLEDLAMEVCVECKRLPLALKVIGSAMLEKKQLAEWRSTLRALKQSNPVGSDVDHRLLLGYNDLKNDVTKICFLYCAAFPEDMRIPISQLCDIWNAHGLFGVLGGKDLIDSMMTHLGILAKRSMIHYDDENQYIVVQDILRDLAKYIISTSIRDDCARECLFETGRVLESFPRVMCLDEVKTMSLNQSSISQWPETFGALHLRVCLLSNMSNLENRLTIPQNFFSKLHNLQHLDLSGNYFNSEQKLPNFKGMSSLSILKLSKCKTLNEVPQSIGELMSLIELDLNGCKALKVIPRSIGELKSLLVLNLKGCESLNELPESIGELKSLTELNLCRCKALKVIPRSIGELKSLSVMRLGNCMSLNELPVSIGELKSLTFLDLRGCKALNKIPWSIGELKSLLDLNLAWCESLIELPKSIGELKSLTMLDLYRCVALKVIPRSIVELKSLSVLKVDECESLKELPKNIGQLKSLTRLKLSGCKALEVISRSIGDLKFLLVLDLAWCESLKELPKNIGQLKSLTRLKLNRCKALKVIPKSIGDLKSLSILDLEGCESLNELPESIGQLKSLIELNLSGCKALKVIPRSIRELKSLLVLKLEGCESLNELP